MSTAAAPKQHKAKDAWAELNKTRPPPGHAHVRWNNVCILLFYCQVPPIGCLGVVCVVKVADGYKNSRFTAVTIFDGG